jgi:hypothetical protein
MGRCVEPAEPVCLVPAISAGRACHPRHSSHQQQPLHEGTVGCPTSRTRSTMPTRADEACLTAPYRGVTRCRARSPLRAGDCGSCLLCSAQVRAAHRAVCASRVSPLEHDCDVAGHCSQVSRDIVHVGSLKRSVRSGRRSDAEAVVRWCWVGRSSMLAPSEDVSSTAEIVPPHLSAPLDGANGAWQSCYPPASAQVAGADRPIAMARWSVYVPRNRGPWGEVSTCAFDLCRFSR